MKKLFPPFLILVMAFVTVFAFTGCASPPPPTPSPQAEEPPTPPPPPPPPPTPQPAPSPVALPSGVLPIFFAPNAPDFRDLTAADRQRANGILRALTEFVNANEGVSIRIEGNANPVTPPGTRERAEEEAILQRLSEQRAGTVLNALVDLGVDRTRLSTMGRGSNDLRAGFEDVDNWYRNRRAEFVLVR